MSDESVRWLTNHYVGLSEEDQRSKVEGRLLDVLSQYGGKRVVAGKVLHDMVQDLTKAIYDMKKDGLI